MNKCLLPVLVLLLCACGGQKREKIKEELKKVELSQDQEANGFLYHMQYLPDGDKNMLQFVVNITETSGRPMKIKNADQFSYGLDSLFGLVNVKDTLFPVDVMRIANGNMGGIQYMLVFERPHAYSDFNLSLFFKDKLFSNQFISFPLTKAAIYHIDSLR